MSTRFRRGNNSANGTGQQAQQKRDPPVYSVKYWSGSGYIEVSVFANKDGDHTNYSTQVKKSFKTGEKDGDKDVWKDTFSFNHQELPLVAQVLNAAFQAIQDIKDGVQGQ
jgi:hypothetical protein